MSKPSFTRREIVRIAAGLSITGVTGALLSACGENSGSDVACASPDDWSMDEAGLRKANGYTESSPHADKTCGNCAFFTADAGATCGSCDIFTGVAHAGGYCTSWSEIPA